jgi:hypothetical protein
MKLITRRMQAVEVFGAGKEAGQGWPTEYIRLCIDERWVELTEDEARAVAGSLLVAARKLEESGT